jgi:hypothetical protein
MKSPWVSRERLDAEAARAQALADRVRVLEARLEDAVAAKDAAQLEAREAVRMVADWLAEKQFGTKIFGSSAPILPSDTPSMDLLEVFNRKAGARRARDLVREGEEKFLNDFKVRAFGVPGEPREPKTPGSE